MSSKERAGYTPPKSRPTPPRNAKEVDARRADRRATFQWLLVGLVIVLIAGLFLLVSGDGGGGAIRPLGRHG